MNQDKIICNKSDLTAVADTIRSKLGVTDTYYVSELSDAIERIPTGTQLPTLTNPGTASDLLSGKELIDQNGNKVTGTIPTKAAATITPGTADQTIPANTYLTGAQTVKGDANLIASNIKSGVSIFGVTGTASGGGGGGTTENKFTQMVSGSLTTVTAEDLQGVTSIGSYAFYKCEALTSVTIPDSVTSIENYAFGNCSKLNSITIPDSVTIINTCAFYFCSALTSITIPNRLKSIAGSTFYQCSALTSVIIPDSVTSIESSAFSNCRNLPSVTIPDSVKSLGSSAFASCSKLNGVTIPRVNKLDNSLFSNCSSLTSITIPNSVTSIGNSVFQNCSSLTGITIPNSVTSIGSNALRIGSSSNKATIIMTRTTPPTITTSTFYTAYLYKIIVPAGTGDTYKSATNWANFASYIYESGAAGGGSN